MTLFIRKEPVESTGLIDLGHVFVSPDGELLYDKGAVQGLIELDATTFKVSEGSRPTQHRDLSRRCP